MSHRNTGTVERRATLEAIKLIQGAIIERGGLRQFSSRCWSHSAPRTSAGNRHQLKPREPAHQVRPPDHCAGCLTESITLAPMKYPLRHEENHHRLVPIPGNRIQRAGQARTCAPGTDSPRKTIRAGDTAITAGGGDTAGSRPGGRTHASPVEYSLGNHRLRKYAGGPNSLQPVWRVFSPSGPRAPCSPHKPGATRFPCAMPRHRRPGRALFSAIRL